MRLVKLGPLPLELRLLITKLSGYVFLNFVKAVVAKYACLFFTRQFVGLTLQASNSQLSETIDGVTGATLSVKAVKKSARFALLLHQLVTRNATASGQNVTASKRVALR